MKRQRKRHFTIIVIILLDAFIKPFASYLREIRECQVIFKVVAEKRNSIKNHNFLFHSRVFHNGVSRKLNDRRNEIRPHHERTPVKIMITSEFQ